MSRKPRTIKPGAVKKIIKSPAPREPEKAEIQVMGADHLYRSIEKFALRILWKTNQVRK